MARFGALVGKMRGLGTGLKQDKAGRWRDKKGRFAKAPPRLRDRAKRAGGIFGRAFLSAGFGLDISEGQSGGGAGFGGGGGRSRSSGGMDVTLPPKKNGKRYSKENTPGLDTISKQVNQLVEIAKKLGISAQKQETELVKAAQTKERSAQESRLEAANDNDASMVSGGDLAGQSITALEPEINKLIDAIRDLRDKIEGQEQGGGIGGALAGGAAAAMALGRGGLNAVGAGISKVGRGAMSVGSKAATAAGNIATKVGVGVSKVKGTAAAASLKGSALKKKIADIAKPLVTKSLAKTAIKSIPIVGAVAGLGFALGRLIKGDPVGAGLDAASGLAGPLTAIPALVASLSRDVYQGVYGIFPEQDPLAGERLGVIKESIEEIAKEQLGQKVEKKEDKKPAAETLPSPAPRMEAKPMESTSSGGGGGAAAGSDAGSSPAAAPMASPAGGEGGSAPGSPVDQAPITPDPAGAIPEPPGMTKSGAAIEAASGEAAAPTMAMGSTGTPITAPATLPTTKPNATGIGDVPDPSYGNAGALIDTLYFGAIAGAMAS